MAGPTPQINLLGFEGDKKAVKLTSPNPVVLPLSEKNPVELLQEK